MHLTEIYNKIDEIKKNNQESFLLEMKSQISKIFNKLEKAQIFGLTLKSESLGHLFFEENKPELIDKYNIVFSHIKNYLKEVENIDESEFKAYIKKNNNNSFYVANNNSFFKVYDSSIMYSEKIISQEASKDSWNKPSIELNINSTLLKEGVEIDFELTSTIDSINSVTTLRANSRYPSEDNLKSFENIFIELEPYVKLAFEKKTLNLDKIMLKKKAAKEVLFELNTIEKNINNYTTLEEFKKFSESGIIALKKALKENDNMFENIQNKEELQSVYQLFAISQDIDLETFVNGTPIKKRGRPKLKK